MSHSQVAPHFSQSQLRVGWGTGASAMTRLLAICFDRQPEHSARSRRQARGNSRLPSFPSPLLGRFSGTLLTKGDWAFVDYGDVAAVEKFAAAGQAGAAAWDDRTLSRIAHVPALTAFYKCRVSAQPFLHR